MQHGHKHEVHTRQMIIYHCGGELELLHGRSKKTIQFDDQPSDSACCPSIYWALGTWLHAHNMWNSTWDRDLAQECSSRSCRRID